MERTNPVHQCPIQDFEQERETLQNSAEESFLKLLRIRSSYTASPTKETYLAVPPALTVICWTTDTLFGSTYQFIVLGLNV